MESERELDACWTPARVCLDSKYRSVPDTHVDTAAVNHLELATRYARYLPVMPTIQPRATGRDPRLRYVRMGCLEDTCSVCREPSLEVFAHQTDLAILGAGQALVTLTGGLGCQWRNVKRRRQGRVYLSSYCCRRRCTRDRERNEGVVLQERKRES
jgi:hypothetical protein